MIPTITVAEISQALYGAWRLFLRDPVGIQFFDDDVPAFWKSFWCAVVILPGYVVLRIFAPGEPLPDADPVLGFAGETVTYVIGWVAWPLLMGHLVPLLEREDRYIRYIVAYNWATGPQILLYLVLMGIGLTGMLPDQLMLVLDAAALIYVLSYHYFVVKVALDLHGWTAGFLVLGEFLLGALIHSLKPTGIAG